jgi:hypothetical protein
MRSFGDLLVFGSRMALLFFVAITVCLYVMPATVYFN